MSCVFPGPNPGGGGGGSGTVTSVGLSLPASVFSVTGSPVTVAGTLTGAFKTQTANFGFFGPVSGAAAVPTFRAMIGADMPFAGTIVNLTDAATIAVNAALWSVNGVVRVTMTGNHTFANPTNPHDGQTLYLEILSSAARTITWDTKYSGAIVGLPTTTSGGGLVDTFLFQYRSAEDLWFLLASSISQTPAQVANVVYAGPTTGSAATPTFRALVAADLPATAVTPGSYTSANITVDAAGRLTAAANGSGGGVTSVGVAVPAALLTVSGSPVTTSGTITLALATQTANLVFAGPTSGSAAAPAFRALIGLDLPASGTVVNLTDASTVAVNAALWKIVGVCRVTLGGNRTIGNPTNPTDGQKMYLEILSTTPRTLTWDTKYSGALVALPGATSGTSAVPDVLLFAYRSAEDLWFLEGSSFTTGSVNGWTDGGSIVYTSTITDIVGIQCTTGYAGLTVGTGGNNASGITETGVLVNKSLSAASPAAHGFRDGTDVSGSTAAFASFSTNISTSGSANMDHFVGFQAVPVFGSSGTIDSVWGARFNLTLANSAIITGYIGVSILNPTGTGTITTAYGLYIEELTKATTRYSIWAEGNSVIKKSSSGAETLPLTITNGNSAVNTAAGLAFDTYGGANTAKIVSFCQASGEYDLRFSTYSSAVGSTLNEWFRIRAAGHSKFAGPVGLFGAIGDVTAKAMFGGTQLVDVTPVGNVTTGEDDLITYSMPAATMSTDGDRIVIEAYGTFAANANSKQVRLYFGGTTIFASGASVLLNGSSWYIKATVTRTGAATQIAIATFDGAISVVTTNALFTSPTETLSGAITVKATGEGVATNDIVQQAMNVDYFPANV